MDKVTFHNVDLAINQFIERSSASCAKFSKIKFDNTWCSLQKGQDIKYGQKLKVADSTQNCLLQIIQDCML